MYIDKNWYDSKKLEEFIESEESNILFEAASVKTRIKLARAARRTARRRVFLTKLRKKKRKATKALQKRAYSEVRQQFRKKLFKGKWSNLSYSARQKIDSIIQRRKPIIDRMIKRIMPSVVRGETQRVQRANKKK
jgi:hypothetical protein